MSDYMITSGNKLDERFRYFFLPGYYLVFTCILFSVIFFIYEPELLNFKLQPFFAPDSSYYNYYLNLHHGLIRIISQFFLQYMAYPFTGAVLLTALLTLLSLLLFYLLNLKEYDFLRGIEFIPSFLILSSLKNYSQGLENLILVLLALIIISAGKLIPLRKYFFRIIYQLIMTGLSFFVLGPVASFALLTLSIGNELFFSRTLWKFLNSILSSGFFFLLLKYSLGLSLLKPYLQTIDVANNWAIMPQFRLILIILISLNLLVYLVSRFFLIPVLSEKISRVWVSLSVIILLLTVGIVFGKYFFRNPQKYNARIEYHANRGEWKEALTYKDKVSINDRISIFELNRALYHQGLMAEKLFTIPQQWGTDALFLTARANRECAPGSSDLFFDLGFIKGSEYWALEAQTFQPYSPRILKRLASCAILLNDQAAANKYLTILSKSQVNRKWAEEIKTLLKAGKTDQIREKWTVPLTIEFDIEYIDNKRPNKILIQLLKADPENQMAFEYLMSYYLLSLEIGNFNYFLEEYGRYDKDNLPGLYQEALIMLLLSRQKNEIELTFTIQKEVKDRLALFNKTLIEYKMDEKRARRDLKRELGGTFWYYMRYNSPQATGGNVQSKTL